jgi:outer membrane protein assembly factor BamB
VFRCVERSGQVAWTTDWGVGRSAAVLYADGHLYPARGRHHALVEANPEKYTLKGKFKLASNNGASWPHPVIVDGRLYLRDQQTLLCYDVSRK